MPNNIIEFPDNNKRYQKEFDDMLCRVGENVDISGVNSGAFVLFINALLMFLGEDQGVVVQYMGKKFVVYSKTRVDENDDLVGFINITWEDEFDDIKDMEPGQLVNMAGDEDED